VINDPALGRTSDSQISVADLTGVAVQDIAVANLVLARLSLHAQRRVAAD